MLARRKSPHGAVSAPPPHEETSSIPPMRSLALITTILAAVAAACHQPVETTTNSPNVRQYGTPQRVGNGTVRTYIQLDESSGSTPIEVGVAMSESAMEGLPAPMAMSAEAMKAAG